MPTTIPARAARYRNHSPLLALLILLGCTFALFMLPAFAGINCFSDGAVGISLETGRTYTPIGQAQVTTSRADVYRPSGEPLQSVDGVFMLWPDYSKTSVTSGVAYHWDRNWQTLPGNPWVLVMCGEYGTPLRPGQPGVNR